MGRPRIHDERTRAALLEMAGRLLADQGPAAVSLRRLAEEVGASTQAIYTLFGSKQGLIRAMHREGFETLDHHLAAVEHDDDLAAHLRALVLAYRASALARPHLYDVMFACPFPEFEPSEEDQRLALGTLERLREALRRHADAGALAGHDPDRLTVQVWALTHGLASLELQGALGDAADAATVWTSAIDLVSAGIADAGTARAG